MPQSLYSVNNRMALSRVNTKRQSRWPRKIVTAKQTPGETHLVSRGLLGPHLQTQCLGDDKVPTYTPNVAGITQSPPTNAMSRGWHSPHLHTQCRGDYSVPTYTPNVAGITRSPPTNAVSRGMTQSPPTNPMSRGWHSPHLHTQCRDSRISCIVRPPPNRSHNSTGTITLT